MASGGYLSSSGYQLQLRGGARKTFAAFMSISVSSAAYWSGKVVAMASIFNSRREALPAAQGDHDSTTYSSTLPFLCPLQTVTMFSLVNIMRGFLLLLLCQLVQAQKYTTVRIQYRLTSAKFTDIGWRHEQEQWITVTIINCLLAVIRLVNTTVLDPSL